jgi:hypothetical protein
MRTLPACLLLLPLLAACDETAKVATPAPTAQRQEAAIRAADERLRARLRAEGDLRTRAIVVHRQAIADTVAVCGQVNPTGRREDAFVPWIAVLSFEAGQVARTEFHLAASGPEATRVYFEMIERCWDGGGPSTGRATGRPLPPAPSAIPITIPDLAPPRAAPALPAQVEATALAPGQEGVATTALGGTVTMSQRTPTNLRAQPSGGGEILRTLPRGATVNVFAEAPGGWLQVGDAEPWGWVHGSLVER